MGACVSKSDLAEGKRDQEIDAAARYDRQRELEKIKLLLLGAGESGKSAIFKQIKLIYGQKPNEDELSFWKQVVHSNVIEAMKAICDAVGMLNMYDDIIAKDELRYMQRVDLKWSLTYPIPSPDNSGISVGDTIKILWNDPGIQKVWEKRARYQVVDSHKIFLDEIDRLKSHDYMPTIADTILGRIRTTGIVAEHFQIDGKTFALYDVGGQRNERKKWIHVFDNVTGVIFVAALSEYDQTLFEDNDKNRMVEALELFEWICNHELFKNVPMILFLNKMDLFRSKISAYPITSVGLWKDYKGGDDFTKAWQYFFEKFHAAGTRSNPSKQIYAHVTCATDTSNVHHVFNSCRDIILKENLAGSGLI